MCWFGNKDKERIISLEDRVHVLELQVEVLTNEICKLIETIGKDEIQIDNIKQIVNHHIQNDMDMTEGDETIWEEN